MNLIENFDLYKKIVGPQLRIVISMPTLPFFPSSIHIQNNSRH